VAFLFAPALPAPNKKEMTMPVDSELYERLKAQVELVSATIRKALADGRLWPWEFLGIGREIARVGVVLAEGLSVPGPEKRAVVIDLALAYWDDRLVDLDIPWLPDEKVDPLLRDLIPLVVGWCVDRIVGKHNANHGHTWPLEMPLE